MKIMVSFRKKCILFLLFLSSVGLMPKNIAHATGNTTSPPPRTVLEGQIYEVRPDGTKDFVTIQEGVDSVRSGDTLLIYPGVYEENVVIRDKTVNLIGVDPQNCILTSNSDNYNRVPLTIAAGKVSNLTICGTSIREGKTILPKAVEWGSRAAIDSNVQVWQNYFSGYVVHIDQPYSLGKELCIENCRIISENNYCIGLGCWANSAVTITDCELIAGGGSGCIFVHNTKYYMDTGAAQVTVKNSSLKNYVGPYVIAVHSEGDYNPIDFTFQNVKVSTVAYEYNECYNITNINTWYNIDQLQSPVIQTLLAENGYLDQLESSQLVHRYTVEQHIKYNDILEARDSALTGWPQLEEGITYWESVAGIPVVLGGVRHSIDMENTGAGIIGDGWCGLVGIYLTENSYGNTLPEMNYPRTAIAGAVTE